MAKHILCSVSPLCFSGSAWICYLRLWAYAWFRFFRLLGSFSFVLLASVSLWIRYFRILGSVWFRLSLLLLGFSFGFGLFVSCFVFASPGLAIGFLVGFA